MPRPPSPKVANASIGIVGAGAGGLSLARILTDRGYANVTVIEKRSRVGGKSLTWHHEGLGHEMGACYSTFGYTTTREWMKEAGITGHALPRHVIRLADGKLEDFKDFVLGEHHVKAYAQIVEYNERWLRFFSRETLGTHPTEWDQEVGQSFGAWLRGHGLDVVARFALRTMCAMGYGHLDEVPALYGLRWNTPSLLLAAATLKVDEPVPGWQHLWQHLADRMDVRTGVEIQKVERNGDHHLLHTDQGDLRFDHLVISSALDQAAEWFPFETAEQDVIGRVHWHEYVTTLVDVDGWFTDADTHSYAKNLMGANGDRRGHLLVARRTGDKTAVAKIRSATRPDVYVCYQYGEPHFTAEDLGRMLAEDIAEEGGRIKQTFARIRWRYAPQLGESDIRAGYARKLEDMQGRHHTWFTGSTMSHEAVDTIVDYNAFLADRMEERIRAAAGEALPQGWLGARRRKWLLSLNNK